MSLREDIFEVLFLSSSSAGNDRDAQCIAQLPQCFVGKALFGTVVVHAGEQYLTRTTLLHLVRPFEESSFCALPAAFQIAVPAVFVQPGVNGYLLHHSTH